MKIRNLILAVSLSVMANLAHAGTSTWTGAVNNDFNNAGNWTNGLPTDVGVINSTPQSSVNISANTTLNTLLINVGASTFTFTNSANALATFNGAGIVNTASQTLQMLNTGTMVFNNSATSGAALINLDGRDGAAALIFNNQASAANSLIKPQDYLEMRPGGLVQFNNSSTADHAIFTASIGHVLGSSLVIQFNDSSNAANAMITGNAYFYATSRAGQATFDNQNSSVDFAGDSTADHSTITSHGSYDFVRFAENSNAGSSIINNLNVSSFLQFQDSASAENATIHSSSAAIVFYDGAVAGHATINNSGFGNDTPGLGICSSNSTDILSDNTNLIFCGTSNAQNAVVSNTDSSVARFAQASSAGSATIINSIAASTNFHDASNASQAVITNTDNHTSINFFDEANAGNSTIENMGSGNVVQFNNSSSAGQATIDNTGGGLVQFNDTSNGGNAAILNTSGTVTIGNLSTSGTTLGSISGAGNILLGSKNLTTGSNGQDADISGVISGTGGSIVKIGTGTLALTGSNSYTGGTTVGGGILTIGSDSSLGSGGGITLASGGTLQTGNGISTHRTVTLTNGGGILDSDGFDSTFAGTIQGSGALVKTGEGTITVSAINNYLGGTYVDEGVLRVGSSQALPSSGAVVLANTNSALDLNGFNQTIGSLSGNGKVLVGTGTLTTGTDNTSTQYNGNITGTGSLVKTGTGTLVLSQIGTFNGTTTVDEGNLNFTGAESGGTASVGTLGGLRNNSAITPGANGIGILHVASYAGAGALNISFNGSEHTALLVDGNADVSGGKLNITGTRFTSGHYSIITAGSLSGTFSGIAVPPSSAFLNVDTRYTTTDVELLITSLNFVDVAQTGNQSHVANALDLGKLNASGSFANVVNAVYALPTDSQARSAYNQMNGDSLASMQVVNLHGSDVFTRQMIERSSPTAEGLWARGLGVTDHMDADSRVGSPAFDGTTSGFQAGYDMELADSLLFGFSGGYAKTSVTVYDRESSGDATAIQSGIHLRYKPSAYFIDGAASFATFTNTMSRTIQFTGINETANGAFQSRVYTTFVEGGYHYQAGKTTSLEPTISLKDSHLNQEGFTETGAPGLNLQVNDQNTNSLVSSLGGRLMQKLWAKSAHALSLGARAAWEHELDQINNTMTAQFADAPAAGQFTVQGTPRSRNAAALGLDARVPMSDSLDAFANYTATLGTGQKTQSYFGGVSLKW